MDHLDLLVPVGTRVADMFFDWKHFKLNKKASSILCGFFGEELNLNLLRLPTTRNRLYQIGQVLD